MPSDSPVSKIGTTFGWSIEAASCASDLKRFRKSRFVGELGGDHLERHVAIEAELGGAVDHAHAALAGHAVDAIAAEDCPGLHVGDGCGHAPYDDRPGGLFPISGRMLPAPNRARPRIRTPYRGVDGRRHRARAGPDLRGGPRGAAGARRDRPRRRRGRDRRGARPVGLGQVDAAARARRARPPGGRDGRGRRASAVTGVGERRLSALRRRHIGYVFQFFHLLPELSGEANVLLAGRVRGAAPEAADARARAGRPARAAARRRSLPHQLSGGEQQRFAIARALVNDPSAAAGRRAHGQPRRPGGRRRARAAARARRRGPRGRARHARARAPPAIADRVLRLEAGRLVPA